MLIRSRFGRAMQASRDHPIAARAMGINTALVDTVTFGISAACAGLGGALLAGILGYIGHSAAMKQFSDWTDRIERGELPFARPSRPEGRELLTVSVTVSPVLTMYRSYPAWRALEMPSLISWRDQVLLGPAT